MTPSAARFPRPGDFWPLLPSWGVCLFAIWGHTYWISADGASHLYNAVALANYIGGDCGAYRELYFFNPYPVPNLTATLLLTWLTTIFPPLVAEKLFLSTYTLLLPLSLRYAIAALEPRGRSVAQLAFPLALGLPVVAGWYNFAAGTVLALFTLGFWLRQPQPLRRSARRRMLGLCLLVYLSHPFPLVVVALVLGWMILWQVRCEPATAAPFAMRVWRRAWPTVKPMLPAAGLLALFWVLYSILAGPGGSAAGPGGSSALRMLLRNEGLAPLTSGEFVLAPLFGAALLALLVAALIPREGRDLRLPTFGLLLAVGSLLLLVLAMPDRAMGGGNLVRRLLVFIPLILLVWLGARPYVRPVGFALAAFALVTTAGQVAFRLPLHDAIEEFHAELRHAGAAIEANDVLLSRALDWTVVPRPEVPPILLRNAPGYLVADRCFVDLSNYEGRLLYSPLVFRPGLQAFHGADPAALAHALEGERPPDRVLLWGVPERLTPQRQAEAEDLHHALGPRFDLESHAERQGLSSWLYRRRESPGGEDAAGSAAPPARSSPR